VRDDPYFGRESLVEREKRLQAEPMGGYVHGKYTSFRVFDATPWHVGQYVMGHWDPTDWRRNSMVGRIGKVIAVNANEQHRGVFTIVVEHPHETLPKQDFNEWRAMRQFDEMAERVHHAHGGSTPG